MGWVRPSSNNNPADWHNEANAYDASEATYAYSDDMFEEEETTELQVSFAAPVSCSEIRIKGGCDYDHVFTIRGYWSAAWHNVWSGSISGYQVMQLGATVNLEDVGIKFYHVEIEEYMNGSIWDIQANEIVPPAGNPAYYYQRAKRRRAS